MIQLRPSFYLALSPWALVMFAVCPGCGSDPGRILSANAVGTPYARLTDYQSSSTDIEQPPAPLRPDTLRDEAVLTRLDGQQSCFDLVMRTAVEFDDGVDQMKPTCEFDDGESEVLVFEETADNVEYPFTAERETARYDETGNRRTVSYSTTETVERTFTVVERKAKLCCATPASARVSLVVRNYRMNQYYPPRARFTWTVQ